MMNSNEEHSMEAGRGYGRNRWGKKRFFKIPFIVAAIILIKAGLVLFLWNELIPDLFHGPVLTFLQAIELTVLAKLLVSGGMKPFGHRHDHGHRFGGRFGKFEMPKAQE